MGLLGPNIKRLEKKGKVRELIKALEHNKKKVCFEAAQALTRLGASEACQPIINAWKSSKFGVNPSVLWAIKEKQDPIALKKIIEDLRHWEKNLKIQIEVYRNIAHRTKTDIYTIAKEDPIGQYSLLNYKEIIHALGVIGDISAIDVLIDGLKDYFNTVKEKFDKSGGHTDFIYQCTLDKYMDPSIPIVIQEAIVNMGEPAIESVTKLLEDDNVAIRTSSKLILDKIKSSTVELQLYSFRIEELNNIQEEDALLEIAKTDTMSVVRIEAVKRIKNEDALIKVAKTGNFMDVRIEALNNIQDEDALLEIAGKDNFIKVRIEAVKRIKNEGSLVKIAKTNEYKDVRIEAVKNIKDEDALLKIAKTNESASVCKEARKAIDKIQKKAETQSERVRPISASEKPRKKKLKEQETKPQIKDRVCEKCGCTDFEFDSYWKETSCKECGWII